VTEGRGGVLLSGEEDAPNNYRLSVSLGGAVGEPTNSPRHRHIFDQVRYLMKGEYSVGVDQVMTEGQIGYFPESVFYGPQLLQPDLQILTLQCGGPGGIGYPSLEQRRKGYEALMQRDGTIEGGRWTWLDENGDRHNKDAHEALDEEVYGHKITYAPPRYDSLILMNPDNYSWVKDPNTPGVARKIVGTFTERAVRIGFIELDTGAELAFGTEPSPEVLFLKEGRISCNGTVHEQYTAFGTTTEEHAQTLTAVAPSELVYIKLATF
jgi:hypothetical protein